MSLSYSNRIRRDRDKTFCSKLSTCAIYRRTHGKAVTIRKGVRKLVATKTRDCSARGKLVGTLINRQIIFAGIFLSTVTRCIPRSLLSHIVIRCKKDEAMSNRKILYSTFPTHSVILFLSLFFFSQEEGNASGLCIANPRHVSHSREAMSIYIYMYMY